MAGGIPITDPVELAWCEFARKREERAWPWPIKPCDQGLSIASFKAGAEWQRAACLELVKAMAKIERDVGATWEKEAREQAPGADALHLRACAAIGHAYTEFANRLDLLVAAIEARVRG